MFPARGVQDQECRVGQGGIPSSGVQGSLPAVVRAGGAGVPAHWVQGWDPHLPRGEGALAGQSSLHVGPALASHLLGRELQEAAQRQVGQQRQDSMEEAEGPRRHSPEEGGLQQAPSKGGLLPLRQVGTVSPQGSEAVGTEYQGTAVERPPRPAPSLQPPQRAPQRPSPSTCPAEPRTQGHLEAFCMASAWPAWAGALQLIAMQGTGQSRPHHVHRQPRHPALLTHSCWPGGTAGASQCRTQP